MTSHNPESNGPESRSEILRLPTVRAAGIPLVAATASTVIDLLRREARLLQGSGIAVHFVNAYTVSLTSDRGYLETFQTDTVNIADGTPLAWLARRANGDVAHLRGPDAFRQVLETPPSFGLRHFLLGGTEESLQRLDRAIRREYPEAQVVGAFSPPFRPFEDSDRAEIDALIRDSSANVVWVGIGTPKQDHEARRLASLHPAFVLAVGAAFNFVSGDVAEAPRFWRASGFEWLYRLFREPRRLWKRYLVGNVGFIFLAWRRRNA